MCRFDEFRTPSIMWHREDRDRLVVSSSRRLVVSEELVCRDEVVSLFERCISRLVSVLGK